MQFEAEANGRQRLLHVERAKDRFIVIIADREWVIDAAQIDPQMLSLLVHEIRVKSDRALQLGDGATPNEHVVSAEEQQRFLAHRTSASYEVGIATDPASGLLSVRVGATVVPVALNRRGKWGRPDDHRLHSDGPQRIVAPMPGKIVKVLVQRGQRVQARQALVVVEAMKMENELRAATEGTVSEIHVAEGQSIDAGTLVAVVVQA